MKAFIYKLFNAPFFENVDSLGVLPRLFIACCFLIIAWLFGLQIKKLSKNRLRKRFDDPLLPAFLANILRIIIVLVGILMALKVMQLGGVATSLMAGAGISAFIIGFALKDIGENFLAGILLASNRPFRVGDLIECNSIKGVVTALNLKDTELKTADGKDVYMPNSMLIKNPLQNYTIDGSHRYEFLVKIQYHPDLVKAKTIIEEIMFDMQSVVNEVHKPSVQLMNISNGGYEFNVYFWLYTISEVSSSNVKTQAMIQIVEKLGVAGFALGNSKED
ncbi:MAG: mechanosensitive ion channel family protein [Bacteroidetes bacterium]|nr:mechanosensitive ion channel family protein [Bacteroidota bacterium]